MEPIINQEIMVFTDTSFARNELKENPARDSISTNPLEQACWSGLLFERLPGLVNKQAKIMYVWKVSQAEEFVHITAGNAPCSPEHATSIDPYFFTKTIHINN